MKIASYGKRALWRFSFSLLFILCLAGTGSNCYAQEHTEKRTKQAAGLVRSKVNSSEELDNSEKPMFELTILSEGVAQEIYYTALMKFQYLDKYRSMKNRREIMFSDGKVMVSLYSAEELMLKYGRPLSPLIPLKEELIPELEFFLTEQGTIKEIFRR